MKSRDILRIKDSYKPYRITKKNSIYILNSTKGDIVIKDNTSIDYPKLYSYLYSRSFDYIPKIVETTDRTVIFEYQDDISIDKNQKAQDLIHLVSLLHNKTSYYKDIPSDSYKEIYETIKNNIYYTGNQYESYYNEFIKEKYLSPSMFLFLRNYSLIFNAINYTKESLNEWFSTIKDLKKERVSLIHNNLSLEHIIKNTDEYLISWDNYKFDTPVLDLYHFYQNEWENISFKEVFINYNKEFNLLDDEKKLLNILISIPFSVTLDDNEYQNTCKIRRLINYLNSSYNSLLEI